MRCELLRCSSVEAEDGTRVSVLLSVVHRRRYMRSYSGVVHMVVVVSCYLVNICNSHRTKSLKQKVVHVHVYGKFYMYIVYRM